MFSIVIVNWFVLLNDISIINQATLNLVHLYVWICLSFITQQFGVKSSIRTCGIKAKVKIYGSANLAIQNVQLEHKDATRDPKCIRELQQEFWLKIESFVLSSSHDTWSMSSMN